MSGDMETQASESERQRLNCMHYWLNGLRLDLRADEYEAKAPAHYLAVIPDVQAILERHLVEIEERLSKFDTI